MKTPQEKIQEILDKCSKGTYIFRGEKQKHNKVSSSLYRLYCEPDNNSDSNTHPPINSKYFSAFTVEKDIVEKARQHFRPDVPNIEVLTELQHYSGKTTLLDFSKDLHIALFFACDGDFDEDGRVILFKTSELPEQKNIDYEKLSENSSENICTLISPTGKTPRVIFQSSIFVRASKGYLKKGDYKIITIEKNLKKPLLEHLRRYFNIRTETIYNDIQGFVRNQHNYATAEIEFYRGYKSSQEKSFEKAIEYYSKAIELNPQFFQAYNNRGNAYRALKQYQDAINDYDEAIELNPQSANAYYNRGNTHLQSANAYYNRGNTHLALKHREKALADFSSAKALFEREGNIAMVKQCEMLITKSNKLIPQ